MSSVIFKAPYVYLTKGTDNQYDLFILVPLENGMEIQYQVMPVYENRLTRIIADIVKRPEILGGKMPKRFGLDPALHASLNDPFDASTFEVQVEISFNTQVAAQNVVLTKKSTIVYGDADTVEVNTPNNAENQIAFNCPYLYLSNPVAEAGDENKRFTPRCIVPLKGNILDQQEMHIQSGDAGVCEQAIILSANGNALESEVPVEELTVNHNEYTDKTPVEGYFAAITIQNLPAADNAGDDPNLPGGISSRARVEETPENNMEPPKRKGRLRNKSSDPNPARFIDFVS